MGDLILAADAHLNGDDPHTESFLRFLRCKGPTAETLILVGDIFDLWIARQGLEMSFHRAVIGATEELRRAGVTVKYVQGNRDYFVGERYGSGPFAEVATEALVEHHAGRRIHVSHGDLVNFRDRKYRLWRRASRSTTVRVAFGMLPAGVTARLSGYLERKMRTTNVAFRVGFPQEEAENYARHVFRQGPDTIVLGHFHEARRVEFEALPDVPAGRLFVLPGWREDRAYLRFDGSGEGRFEEFRE